CPPAPQPRPRDAPQHVPRVQQPHGPLDPAKLCPIIKQVNAWKIEGPPMPTSHPESDAVAQRPTRDRLLLLLKTPGPHTAADLGAVLGVTGEAARQQLLKLAADGLVEATAAPHGVGRPAQVWGLTEKGHARFPDTHAELTVQLLQAVRSELGEKALD